MKDIITLLKPRIYSFKGKGFSKNNKGDLFKLLLFGTIGLLFWGGIFAVSLRVLGYFKEIAELAAEKHGSTFDQTAPTLLAYLHHMIDQIGIATADITQCHDCPARNARAAVEI